MSDALYIAAKAPRIGFAKTRLGASIGHERAIELYKAFLRDLSERFSGSRFGLGWYVTPPDSWPEISELTNGEDRVLFQGEGDLTERQRDLFRSAAGRGEERVVLIGADSPQLTVGLVEEAFSRLDHEDLVLGPTLDGGYYLIGMRGWHDVLQGIPMSTGTELDGIIALAESRGNSVGLLEATFDVDVEEDLHHLRKALAGRDDLDATREAMETLGLLGGEYPTSGPKRKDIAP